MPKTNMPPPATKIAPRPPSSASASSSEILHCFRCDFQTKDRDKLKKHERTHQTEHAKKLPCERGCTDKTFGSDYDRKRHYNTMHNLQREMYECNHCNKSYASRQTVNKHAANYQKTRDCLNSGEAASSAPQAPAPSSSSGQAAEGSSSSTKPKRPPPPIPTYSSGGSSSRGSKAAKKHHDSGHG
jgi:hypothetical protein